VNDTKDYDPDPKTEQSHLMIKSLKLQHLALLLLLPTQLEMLAPFDGDLVLSLAISAFQPEHNLLGGLGLLPEDGFGLTTISFLLAVVSPLALSSKGVFALLVLGDLVKRVLSALGSPTESPTGFGNIHHFKI